MKRNNLVVLDGLIQLINFHNINNLSHAELRVTTDPHLPGGSHQVIVNDILARETLAFVIATRFYQVDLYGTLYGWAYSPSNSLYIIADRVNFYVPPQIREQAVGVLKSLGNAENLPLEVKLNGSRIAIAELLGTVVSI
jgi:hypothetical protein